MLASVASLVVRLLLLVAAGVVGFNVVTFAVAFVLRPGTRPPRLAAAFTKEMAAALALIPLYPLYAWIGEKYEREEQGVDPDPLDRRPPVILLHGFAMNRTNWLWLGPALVRRRLGPLFGMTYFTMRPVAASAERFARFVDGVRASTGAERVDVVAHSLGGLVARYYIEHLDGADKVRRLVTIATPHHGTRWARLAIGGMRDDLLRGAPIPDGAALGRALSYTSIWSRCDNLILPPESCRLATDVSPELDRELGLSHAEAPTAGTDAPVPAHDVEDIVFDDLGHLSLLCSPRVADAVARRLAA